MKFLDYPDLREEHGISFTSKHLLTLERAGKFPKRCTLGGRNVFWVADEVAAWCEAKANERNAA